jgi:3-oxoacyl-[acyl-carrier-protein] synthase-3
MGVRPQKSAGSSKAAANDIDLIILATSTPDFIGGFPSTACVVQNKLGLTNGAPAMDVQAVCRALCTHCLSLTA